MEEHPKRTSIVWNYFTAVDNMMATCDICSMRLSYKSTVSNLMKHINRRHPDAIKPNKNETLPDQANEEYYVLNTSTNAPSAKTRPVRSPMWKYFKKLDDNYASCELCSKRLSFKSTVSNLVKHLKRSHANAYVLMKEEAAEANEEKYIVFSDRSSEADEAEQQPDHEDQLWNYFERETGGRARCVLCRSALPTHSETLGAHLKKYHTKLALQFTQESDAELEGEDNELISEIVYLEDGNEGSEKKYTTIIDHDQRSDSYKRRKRHRDDDVPLEKYRIPKVGRNSVSSEDDRPVLLVASGKKENEEADAFGKYLMHLLKSLPKHIQTKLQMEIVNVVMKAKLEYEAKLQEREEEEEKNAASAAKDSRYSVMVARNEPLRRIVCRSDIDIKKDSTLGGIDDSEISIVTEDGATASEVNLPTTFTGIHSM